MAELVITNTQRSRRPHLSLIQEASEEHVESPVEEQVPEGYR